MAASRCDQLLFVLHADALVDGVLLVVVIPIFV
jgi:hypothetical protein